LAASSGCIADDAGLRVASAALSERGHALPDESERDRDAARASLVQGPLTPERAAKLAILNHPRVSASRAVLAMARGELVRAARFRTPSSRRRFAWASERPRATTSISTSASSST
jgi:hypothetical protein